MSQPENVNVYSELRQHSWTRFSDEPPGLFYRLFSGAIIGIGFLPIFLTLFAQMAPLCFEGIGTDAGCSRPDLLEKALLLGLLVVGYGFFTHMVFVALKSNNYGGRFTYKIGLLLQLMVMTAFYALSADMATVLSDFAPGYLPKLDVANNLDEYIYLFIFFGHYAQLVLGALFALTFLYLIDFIGLRMFR